MTDHSTRRAAFLAAVRDAFDEHYPRPRPEDDALVELPDAVWLDDGDLMVRLDSGRVQGISRNRCTPTNLDRIAAACTAWAAIEAAGWAVKRRDAIEEMEATLEAYVSDFCEGFCAECDLDYADKDMLNDCSGCRARVALAKAGKP